MKKHILTAVLISGLVCSSLASCTLETYESTTPRSANWSVSTPTNASGKNNQTAATQAAPVENNAQGQQQAAPAQQNQQPQGGGQQATAAVQAQTAAPAQQAPAIQPPKADPPEVTASPAQQQAAVTNDYSEYVPIARNIMNSLDVLDNIAGGSNVSVDAGDTVQDGGYTYSRVLDYRFSSVNDVVNFMNTLVCGDLVYRYSGLYSGEAPTFKEFNGSLYYLNETRGSGFGYQGDPTITSASGGSFSFNVQIAAGGGVKNFAVNAVNDGGTWKACSFNYS
jgi:hypothetical protein